MADREAVEEAVISTLAEEGPMTLDEIAETVSGDGEFDRTIVKAVLANLVLGPELEPHPERDDVYRIPPEQ